MSEMIERVARALCKRYLMKAGLEMAAEGLADPVALTAATQRGVDGHWRDFIEDARAAIEALREPTEAILMAGWETGCLESGPNDSATIAWHAMIDAALKEPQTA